MVNGSGRVACQHAKMAYRNVVRNYSSCKKSIRLRRSAYNSSKGLSPDLSTGDHCTRRIRFGRVEHLVVCGHRTSDSVGQLCWTIDEV